MVTADQTPDNINDAAGQPPHHNIIHTILEVKTPTIFAHSTKENNLEDARINYLEKQIKNFNLRY